MASSVIDPERHYRRPIKLPTSQQPERDPGGNGINVKPEGDPGEDDDEDGGDVDLGKVVAV